MSNSLHVWVYSAPTHPLSEALTMYCFSLLALALDRQVTEVLWPNSRARGLICTTKTSSWAAKQTSTRERGWFYIQNTKKGGNRCNLSPQGQGSSPRCRSDHHGSRWWWWPGHPSPAGWRCSGWEHGGPTALWVIPDCFLTCSLANCWEREKNSIKSRSVKL